MPDSSRSRVLLFIDSVHCGGAQRQLCHLGIGLKELGHDVSVAVYYPQYNYFKSLLHQHGIRLLEMRKAGTWRMVRELAQLVASQQIDWVVSFLEGPGIYALLTKLWSRNFKVCVAERSANMSDRFSLKQRVLRRLYPAANRITTNSEYQATLLRRKYPRIANRVETIRNCVGDPFFAAAPEETNSLRHDWDYEHDWLAVVGQIAPWKNLHGLIDGLLECRRQYGETPRIRWAGRPAEAFSEYVLEQQRRLTKHTLDGRVELLGNIDDVPSFLRSASGLLHPSIIEGFPNAVCEALAVGLPALIGDISDARFLVNDQRGLLFDPNSAQSIADCLRRFMQLSGPERQAMGAAGREFAIREFRQDVMAAKYSQILFVDR